MMQKPAFVCFQTNEAAIKIAVIVFIFFISSGGKWELYFFLVVGNTSPEVSNEQELALCLMHFFFFFFFFAPGYMRQCTTANPFYHVLITFILRVAYHHFKITKEMKTVTGFDCRVHFTITCFVLPTQRVFAGYVRNCRVHSHADPRWMWPSFWVSRSPWYKVGCPKKGKKKNRSSHVHLQRIHIYIYIYGRLNHHL